MAQFTGKTRFDWPSNIYLGLRTAGTNTFVCMLADRQQMKKDKSVLQTRKQNIPVPVFYCFATILYVIIVIIMRE